ncbi:ferredoxin [Gordonia paraffinivorans]|uniref:Ferredoxin n=2 Tax=Gordonia paraffinivorans TaxID=175628 RepID=A0ABQ0IHV6_9ACTN|nr:ferredoxin [Gordonia paraffinivorans]MCD2146668.1 ferredoxin [Gordonia paraffinivorans]GAC83064.1 putative 3Fe-4S ferredoxin [Gordonia paraffinivorans NBRC 108238]VFA88140.1 Ferredoxin-1 [Gordonia paraffinivorans]
MRIEVDLDLCQGHGMCEMEAPGIFEARRDHVEILEPEPDESRRAEVEAAVQYCPTQALRIIEDDQP